MGPGAARISVAPDEAEYMRQVKSEKPEPHMMGLRLPAAEKPAGSHGLSRPANTCNMGLRGGHETRARVRVRAIQSG